ncbi:MAG: hypothetical protein E6L07_01210, partial [Verrucomicrobia bacterium]
MAAASSAQQQVTQLLVDWSSGDTAALDKLIPLVQPELHRLAHHYMSREGEGHTLQTTALVNEAYLQFVDKTHPRWQNRPHFFAVAAQLMRRIMVDHARQRHALKRGGAVQKVTLDEAALVTETRAAELLALDEALENLAAFARLERSESMALRRAERRRMLMEPGRWGRITDIYHATIARPSEERASFLGEECHGDESLRKQVEAMVKSHERSGDFIESPAFEVAPELLIDEPTGDLIGQSIGHYWIESLLGMGGMGEVYLARDERLGRKVALKLLPEHLTADETQLSRFKSEARAASALNHPNILTVYEIGAEGNRQFIATEFIEGMTLRASLACGKMNLHAALEIAVQVASALAAAHETGVVHRDIKPENIMLRPDGYAKVLDFGIAKLTEQRPASDHYEVGTTAVLQTRPGLVLGTGRYMSPEQTRGQKVDARSDIWSLGVVLYEVVGGIPPFPGETPSDCIASILTTEPPPLSGVLSDVPLKLESILQKALRKNSDERYQTINEMLADLRNLKGELEAEGSSPQTKARAESIVSKIKRHKRGMLLTLVAILAAAAFAYSFFFVAPAPSPNEKSIAVLPFQNRSEDKSNAYFTDGVQDEILTRLSKIRDLKVISRTSTQRYKNTSQDL